VSEISTEITVDGKRVDYGEAGCITEHCPITREWTLESSSYATGKHTILAKATDGLGNTTSKSLTVEIQRDTTKPSLEASGGLFNAPMGWVEQESYSLNASATDSGYGVVSIALKLDGTQIGSTSQACLDGGCPESFVKSINMSTYTGGAHHAELIATDGAGNTSSKAWTINVDPEGNISTGEATATLEAVDTTSLANTVGEAKEESSYEGTAPGLGVEQQGGALVVSGTQVPATISKAPSGGVTMEVLDADVFAVPCVGGVSSSEKEAVKEAEAVEEVNKNEEPTTEFKEQESCKTQSELEQLAKEAESSGEYSNLESAQITPTSTNASATTTGLVGEVATVAANTALHVDTITRPLYEGAMVFQAIRDVSGPESYSWEVHLDPGQELKLIDGQHAEVYYEGGHPAFGIAAEPAHDAVGTTVPTVLSVSAQKIVTLTVKHHAAAYVYPVIAGTGWQSGFTTEVVQGPKDETELREERERIEREEREAQEAEEHEEPSTVAINESGASLTVDVAAVGPPVADASARGDPSSTPIRAFTMTHKFKFSECRYSLHFELPEPPPEIPGEWRREATKLCKKQIESPSHIHLVAGMSVHGWYHDNQKSDWVWISKGNLQCDKWGEEQPALVHCEKRPLQPSHDNVYLLGDYRFAPGKGNFFSTPLTAACETVRGRLEVGPSYHQEESLLSPARAAYGSDPAQPCSWP
jgi:hypothetical protein